MWGDAVGKGRITGLGIPPAEVSRACDLLHNGNSRRDYVTFSVPNPRVVRKITLDWDDKEDLRRQIYG